MLDIKSLFAGGKQLAGLDIGSSSIKLAEVQETPKGRILTRFFRIPLAKGIIVDGTVAEPEALTATIKDLFKQSGCKVRKVATSISGNAVIIKKASFAQMDPEELRSLIHDEAGKYLPFDDMSTVDFDFQIVGDNPYNTSQMEVLIVAAKKDIIEAYTDAIKSAGLIPAVMDVDSFAIQTMYEENYETDENDVVILVNVGAGITNVNAVKGGVSIFTRDFTLGGNSITDALVANLGVPFDEAEKAKIEGVGDDAQAKTAYREGLVSYADPLSTEIERSVDYFRSTFGAENISKLILSGGGGMIPGMAADLANRMGIETEIANPFKKIKVGDKVLEPGAAERVGPIAAVCVGLAMRTVGDQ